MLEHAWGDPCAGALQAHPAEQRGVRPARAGGCAELCVCDGRPADAGPAQAARRPLVSWQPPGGA